MFGLILGIILFLLIFYIIPFEGLSYEGKGVLATLALMACWWSAESIQTGITGLLPLVLFPMIGALDGASTAAAYGNNTIFMLFGGFVISMALERWNLHNRIALTIMKYVGTSINGLLLGLMIAGGFLSMWVSNAATILMLLPIAMAVAENISTLMKKNDQFSEDGGRKFKKASIFSIGFGGIIGGSTTLIGTPTNAILAGFTPELIGYEVPFGQFLIFMLPVSILQYFILYVILTRITFKFSIKEIKNTKDVINEQIEKLGEPSYEEKSVFVVFIITVFFWLSRTYLFGNVPGLSDAVISIIATVALYLLPTKNKGTRILESDSIKKMPWNVILMLMGGMAVAAGFTQTDLASYLGSLLLQFENTSMIFMIIVIVIFGILITQVAPNTATATIIIPLTATLAKSMNLEPFYLMLAAALGPGFSTTLPAGTPVMGIMYGTGEFTVGELIKTGGMLMLFSFPLIVLAIYFYAPIIFGI